MIFSFRLNSIRLRAFCFTAPLSIIFSVQEYEEDGIDWTKVEFVDNQECLDLIEKVINGVPRIVILAYKELSGCFYKYSLACLCRNPLVCCLY